ncbi:hypothetical protein ACFL2K_00405 [Candidatus Margulisiibacteriota bacterium]
MATSNIGSQNTILGKRNRKTSNNPNNRNLNEIKKRKKINKNKVEQKYFKEQKQKHNFQDIKEKVEEAFKKKGKYLGESFSGNDGMFSCMVEALIKVGIKDYNNKFYTVKELREICKNYGKNVKVKKTGLDQLEKQFINTKSIDNYNNNISYTQDDICKDLKLSGIIKGNLIESQILAKILGFKLQFYKINNKNKKIEKPFLFNENIKNKEIGIVYYKDNFQTIFVPVYKQELTKNNDSNDIITNIQLIIPDIQQININEISSSDDNKYSEYSEIYNNINKTKFKDNIHPDYLEEYKGISLVENQGNYNAVIEYEGKTGRDVQWLLKNKPEFKNDLSLKSGNIVLTMKGAFAFFKILGSDGTKGLLESYEGITEKVDLTRIRKGKKELILNNAIEDKKAFFKVVFEEMGLDKDDFENEEIQKLDL